jgi:hypothetical protein
VQIKENSDDIDIHVAKSPVWCEIDLNFTLNGTSGRTTLACLLLKSLDHDHTRSTQPHQPLPL